MGLNGLRMAVRCYDAHNALREGGENEREKERVRVSVVNKEGRQK